MTQVVKKVLSFRKKHSPARDELIDYLRGGAMILVLLHHSGFPLGPYILAFHMPLFFVLAGYLEHIGGGKKKPFNEYVKRRFLRLVIPYFAFETINLIIWAGKCFIEHQPLPGFECVISILTCVNNEYMGMYGRLWFLPCMFVADLYVWGILRLWRKNRIAQIISILVLFALSFITSTIIPFRLPFTLDTALFAAAFMMIGYVFFDEIKAFLNKGKDLFKILLAFSMLLFLAYAVRFLGASVKMYANSYGAYPASIAAAIAGSIAFLILGSFLYRGLRASFIRDFVLWYGNNSLATFPVHLTIKMFILYYVPVLSRWYLLFFVMLFLNIPIVNGISNYFPFMLGKPYRKQD